MKNLFLTLLLSLILLSITFSQAWVRSKGAGYSQLGFNSITGASKIYGTENKSDQLRRVVNDQTIQGYVEYGLGNKMMVTGSAPFKILNTGDEIFETAYLPDTLPAGSLNAFGNITGTFIYGLSQDKKWVSSLALGVDTRTAMFKEEVGLRSGVDACGLLFGGNIGRGWDKMWVQGSLGYKYRTNSYSDQIVGQAQVGRTLNKVQVMAGLELYHSLKNGSFDDGTSVHTALYQNDLEFFSYYAKVSYAFNEEIKLWGLIGGGITGAYVAKAPAYSLTLSYEWKQKVSNN